MHKAPEAFAHANQAAHAFILADSEHAVICLFYRQGRTHFGAVAALIAKLNPAIGIALCHPDGALRFIRFFEVGLGADFFAGAAAGTFGSIGN
jgi:hypothetical protein